MPPLLRHFMAASLLTACSASPPPSTPEPSPPFAWMPGCPVAPRQPIPPPIPRTFDSVVRWAQAVELARERTVSDLERCRAALIGSEEERSKVDTASRR